MKIIIWYMFIREILRALKLLKGTFADETLEKRIASFISMCMSTTIIYFLYLFIFLSRGI